MINDARRSRVRATKHPRPTPATDICIVTLCGTVEESVVRTIETVKNVQYALAARSGTYKTVQNGKIRPCGIVRAIRNVQKRKNTLRGMCLVGRKAVGLVGGFQCARVPAPASLLTCEPPRSGRSGPRRTGRRTSISSSTTRSGPPPPPPRAATTCAPRSAASRTASAPRACARSTRSRARHRSTGGRQNSNPLTRTKNMCVSRTPHAA